MMLAEKKAPQQVSAAMLIPFRRERARALRVLALAALTTTTAPQGTTRRCADEQPSPTPCDSHANALPPMLPPPHPTPMQHLVLLSLHAAPAGQQQVLCPRAPRTPPLKRQRHEHVTPCVVSHTKEESSRKATAATASPGGGSGAMRTHLIGDL